MYSVIVKYCFIVAMLERKNIKIAQARQFDKMEAKDSDQREIHC